jgi:hypothetical protein
MRRSAMVAMTVVTIRDGPRDGQVRMVKRSRSTPPSWAGFASRARGEVNHNP